MYIEKVKITNTKNGMELNANVLSRSNEALTVYLVAGESKITLIKNKLTNLYVGTKAGMEFTSTGKEIR